MGEQRWPFEARLLRALLGDVHRCDERAALLRKIGLGVLRVAKLTTTVCIASGLENAPRRVDRIEAVLGVRGERAAELRELGYDLVAALVRGVLEDRVLTIA